MKVLNKEEKAAYIEQLVEKEKNKESWRKYYKDFDFVTWDCGAVQKIPKDRIDSKIYYPDDYEDPLKGDKEKAFCNINISRNFTDYGYEEWVEQNSRLANDGVCSGSHLTDPILIVSPYHNSSFCSDVRLCFQRPNYIEPKETLVVLSPKEVEEYGEYIRNRKGAYMKRLKTYWKRYGSKVTSVGYWMWE